MKLYSATGTIFYAIMTSLVIATLFTERGVDNREVDIHYRWDDKKNSFIEFKRVNIDEK